MSSLHQYDGWTAEEIVARNSHELTAVHILGARRYILEQRAAHAEALLQLKASIADAHRIGIEVMQAKRAGRKTIRIDEVTR